MNDLAQIGQQPDGAVHRVAYSPADLDARQWLNARLRQLDLDPLSTPEPKICHQSQLDRTPTRYQWAVPMMARWA